MFDAISFIRNGIEADFCLTANVRAAFARKNAGQVMDKDYEEGFVGE